MQPKTFFVLFDTDVDPRPPSNLSLDVTVACLQGDEDSCLRHSMASALPAMGFVPEAKAVHRDPDLVTQQCVMRLTTFPFKIVRC
jgi:hypothetical protein